MHLNVLSSVPYILDIYVGVYRCHVCMYIAGYVPVDGTAYGF